jgi:putative ABC transport system ATP-binding protein
MIQAKNLHKSFTLGDRSVPALRGASLSVDEPGFYAIMGASGSGKSTMLHLLAAMDRPDSGTITIDGQELSTLGERELTLFRRSRVGVVFQQFNLIPTLTAQENAELPGLLAGEAPARLRARSTELLEALGVLPRATHRPDALSGGEQQRVAIARALLFRPALILADEPTGALDSASARALWTLLADVAARQRTTVAMVTHEPAAAAHCRRVFVMKDGVITGHFDTEGLDASGVAARYQQSVG